MKHGKGEGRVVEGTFTGEWCMDKPSGELVFSNGEEKHKGNFKGMRLVVGQIFKKRRRPLHPRVRRRAGQRPIPRLGLSL